MSKLREGTACLYLPHAEHWHDTDVRGDWIFQFVHVEDGPPLPLGRQHERIKKGDPVTEKFGLGERAHDMALGYVERRDADGTLHLSRGHTIRPVGMKEPWSGVVRAEVDKIFTEAQAVVQGIERTVLVPVETYRLVLDVKHPNGYTTLHLPLEGPGTVPCDPTGQQSHSYRLAEEGGQA